MELNNEQTNVKVKNKGEFDLILWVNLTLRFPKV